MVVVLRDAIRDAILILDAILSLTDTHIQRKIGQPQPNN
jgi:hypothetical protein